MAHSHHLIDTHHIDEHPAAMFGLMIGTLAVLMTVLVLSIYSHASNAGRQSGGAPVHSATQR